MHFTITSKEREEWDRTVGKVPKIDIFYTWKYMNLFEFIHNSKAELFVYQNGKKLIIYPYFKAKTRNGYKIFVDRYGGPLSNTKNLLFFRDFLKRFNSFCSESGIWEEKYKLHPFLIDDVIAAEIKTRLIGRMVYINLEKNQKTLWYNISKSHRRCIKKAKGLEIKTSNGPEDLKIFHRLYIKTMKSVNADKKYFLPLNYFKKMRTKVKEYFELVNVLHKDHTILSSIILKFKPFVYFCYGGQERDSSALHPKHFQIFNSMLLYKRQGYSYLILGSGRTVSIDDSLFNFKLRFSGTYKNVYQHKVSHN